MVCALIMPIYMLICKLPSMLQSGNMLCLKYRKAYFQILHFTLYSQSVWHHESRSRTLFTVDKFNNIVIVMVVHLHVDVPDEKLICNYVMVAARLFLVLEPDPWKLSLVNGAEWNCTLWNVLIAEPSVVNRAVCTTRHVLIFPAWFLMKQNAKCDYRIDELSIALFYACLHHHSTLLNKQKKNLVIDKIIYKR